MEEKKWFEEWFNSPYYHLLYSNRSEDEAEMFITALVDKLNITRGAKVLDVACGKGRHSRTLAKLGFNVTGIDLSKNSIDYAKQFENKQLHFDVWDMRKVYKQNEFDYVLNLFSSFGYFNNEDEDKAAICAFADNLKPGGTLLIDYINTECAVKNMDSRSIVPRGDIQFHIQKKVENGYIKKKIDFLAEGVNYSFEEQLEIINLYRFKEMLQSAALELKAVYGDYELNEFDPAKSQRLILVAQK
ncbi:MAG: hypothetical protein JWO06_678 [Bacteroidota bacterium]|nr:hypothetical protein [Bacteroidota bacterium]